MLYPYKKGNGEWTNSVPLHQEAVPYTPLWSSGDGYQINNLFIYRQATGTTVTTAAYQGQAVIYDQAVLDNTDWYDVTTGAWTPQLAGWWQVIAAATNDGGQGAENVINLGVVGQSQLDAVGMVNGTVTTIAYFNGTTDNIGVSVSTANPNPVDHVQNPQTCFFQALYLRP